MTVPLLQIDAVSRAFGGGRTLIGRPKARIHALQNVSLNVERGETLGIIGESGSGKTTLARLLVGLDRPTEGRILLNGTDVSELRRRSPRELAKHIQYVFQDPVSSLNPRQTIRTILEAPLKYLHSMPGEIRHARVSELLAAVNLRDEFLDRYPHEFSGGQSQRIGLARALAAQPNVIVLDEPVSSLDVSVRTQVLNLLDDIKRHFRLTYVLISHDLAVIESMCDRVAVMYFGRVVESGPATSVLNKPLHPYTALLSDSVPRIGKREVSIDGALAELPDPLAPPPGCAFAPRCDRASSICRADRPELHGERDEHRAACYHRLRPK
jgi:oligopeptide/dipeptide ABC transporter ATP-binding protein